jgi:hypothetical protein
MFGAKQHRRRQQYHANNFRQLMENFRRKRAESLSWLFVAIWLTGDLSNLTGCLLTGQLPFQTYLASYFVMMDTLLMFQWVYYNRNDGTSLVEDDEQTVPLLNEDTDEAPTGENYARFHKQPLNPSLPILTLTMGLIALTVPTMAIPTNQRVLSAFDDSVPWHYRLGEASAWLSVACYLSSRLPQIHKNVRQILFHGYLYLL